MVDRRRLVAAKLFDKVIPSFGGYGRKRRKIRDDNCSRVDAGARRQCRVPAPPQRATPLDPRRSPERSRPPTQQARAGSRGRGAGAEPATRAASPAGSRCLRAALRNVPASPGVYRMLDRKGDALYVGKARNLKSRVQNYTHPAGLSNRLRRMVAETATLEIVVTAHRGRGAAARMQPDQAPDAALQRAAARRQVVSVHPSDRRSRFPAADQVPRRARQGRAPISGRSPRPARSTAR